MHIVVQRALFWCAVVLIALERRAGSPVHGPGRMQRLDFRLSTPCLAGGYAVGAPG